LTYLGQHDERGRDEEGKENRLRNFGWGARWLQCGQTQEAIDLDLLQRTTKHLSAKLHDGVLVARRIGPWVAAHEVALQIAAHDLGRDFSSGVLVGSPRVGLHDA